MPSTSSVGKYGVQEAEISVNLVSVDQNINSLAVEGWKETYLNKIGSLYKVPDWQEAEIEITVTIPLQAKPDAVVVHLNCDVTNLTLDGTSKTLKGMYIVFDQHLFIL